MSVRVGEKALSPAEAIRYAEEQKRSKTGKPYEQALDDALKASKGNYLPIVKADFPRYVISRARSFLPGDIDTEFRRIPKGHRGIAALQLGKIFYGLGDTPAAEAWFMHNTGRDTDRSLFRRSIAALAYIAASRGDVSLARARLRQVPPVQKIDEDRQVKGATISLKNNPSREIVSAYCALARAHSDKSEKSTAIATLEEGALPYARRDHKIVNQAIEYGAILATAKAIGGSKLAQKIWEEEVVLAIGSIISPAEERRARILLADSLLRADLRLLSEGAFTPRTVPVVVGEASIGEHTNTALELHHKANKAGHDEAFRGLERLEGVFQTSVMSVDPQREREIADLHLAMLGLEVRLGQFDKVEEHLGRLDDGTLTSTAFPLIARCHAAGALLSDDIFYAEPTNH